VVEYYNWELRIHELKGKMDRGELISDPDWQRGYIWKLRDEQLLIDSILKGMPIPKFYLTEEYDAKKGCSVHYVVDGQQRLTAIYRFLDNKFVIKIDGKEYFFKDLDRTTQQKITTYKFNGHYLQNFNQPDINFLFQRINSTGIKLNNMEKWNNEYDKTNILEMVKEIYLEHRHFYEDLIYTNENVKRMIPLDDIIDLCNCLNKGVVASGRKPELDSCLKTNRNISESKSSKLKSKFRKTLANIETLFSKQDIQASSFGKRTHFISLFLAIGLLINKYYILRKPDALKKDLLDFIVDPSEKYKKSVLGAIRQKTKREERVKIISELVLKHSQKLDQTRNFPAALKQKIWRRDSKHICQICKKEVKRYQNVTLDHIVPWAKGGKTVESNAQLAHRRCNQRKQAKEEEFLIT